ncbi:cytochrome P450 [Aspergillus recurvatus]
MLQLTILALPALYTVACIVALLHNRSLAQRTNLPYVLFPVYESNLIYVGLTGTQWFSYIVKHWLPESIADHVLDSVYRHRWAVKNRMVKRYGGVYLYVTPGGITCNVADARVVQQVCRARQSFMKRVKYLDALDLFGRNVFTTEGSQWSYHHRYTAPAFSEKNNTLVWREAVQQAEQMTEYWSKEHSNPRGSSSSFALPDVGEDIHNLTLNVISSAGFGVRLPFKRAAADTSAAEIGLIQEMQDPPAGYCFTFTGVMQYMSRSIVSVLIANGVLARRFPCWLMPFFKKEFIAHRELGKYLQNLIENAGRSNGEAHNLLGRLVMSRRDGQKVTSKRDPGLTASEILGNTYIFFFAGHETSGTTLRFALVLLALYTDVQDELYREIQTVLDGQPADPAEWDYDSVYPQLVTPLCIMLETLRLYPAAVNVAKETSDSGADITYKGQAHRLPPKIRVNIDISAVHRAEEYWGPDAGIFSPRRWDKRNPDSFLARNEGMEGLSGPGLESPSIHKPVRGAFVAFSDGERACVGRKFAQVEFVAVLAVLFREYRVSLGKVGTGSDEDARERVKRALEESSSPLTLGIMEKVPLVFRRRDTV